MITAQVASERLTIIMMPLDASARDRVRHLGECIVDPARDGKAMQVSEALATWCGACRAAPVLPGGACLAASAQARRKGSGELLPSPGHTVAGCDAASAMLRLVSSRSRLADEGRRRRLRPRSWRCHGCTNIWQHIQSALPAGWRTRRAPRATAACRTIVPGFARPAVQSRPRRRARIYTPLAVIGPVPTWWAAHGARRVGRSEFGRFWARGQPRLNRARDPVAAHANRRARPRMRAP